MISVKKTAYYYLQSNEVLFKSGRNYQKSGYGKGDKYTKIATRMLCVFYGKRYVFLILQAAFMPSPFSPESQKIMAVCSAFQAVFGAFWSHLALLNHNQEHRKECSKINT
jgi:hypothetical protein